MRFCSSLLNVLSILGVTFVFSAVNLVSALETEGLKQSANTYIERCSLCHGNNAMGEGLIPIKVNGYPSTNLIENVKYTTKQQLRDVISNGVPGKNLSHYMPPWKQELSEQQIEDMIDLILYLRSDPNKAVPYLIKANEDRIVTTQQGKTIFRSRCSLCHGKEGAGDGRMAKIITSPPPANLHESVAPAAYLKLIISKGGEAVGRSPQMPPWDDQLTDNEIKAIVAYIMSLRQKK